LSAEAGPEQSLPALMEELNAVGLQEHNAAVDRNEAAIAEIVRMFGEDFCFERDRGQDSYSNPSTAMVLDRVRERMARVASLEQDLLTGSLPGLFRAFEDKLYEIQLAREALAVTVDIPSVARQLKGLPADLQQAAVDRRECDRSDARSETGQKGGKSARQLEKATRGFAISLWEKAPADASVRSVALNIEAAVVAHALKLGWEMAADNQHRTIYGWLLAAKSRRRIK